MTADVRNSDDPPANREGVQKGTGTARERG